jgi:hypothetical protein
MSVSSVLVRQGRELVVSQRDSVGLSKGAKEAVFDELVGLSPVLKSFALLFDCIHVANSIDSGPLKEGCHAVLSIVSHQEVAVQSSAIASRVPHNSVFPWSVLLESSVSSGVGAVSGVISGIATAAPSATSASPSSSGSPGVGCQSEHQDCNNVASHFE